MTMKLYTESYIEDIADAIRTKGGSGTYKVSEMAQAIEDLPSGSGGFDPDVIAEQTMSGNIVLDTATTIRKYAFFGNASLTKVTAPHVTSVQQQAFESCTNCEFDLPEVISVAQAFRYVERSLYLPKCTTITGTYGFGGKHTDNTYIALPRLTSAIPTDGMRGCSSQIIDIGKCPSIGTRGLYQGMPKTVLVMRKTDGVCALTSGALNKASTLNIYVPNDLLTEYQSATNWSSLTGVVWNALERSKYESEDWPLYE